MKLQYRRRNFLITISFLCRVGKTDLDVKNGILLLKDLEFIMYTFLYHYLKTKIYRNIRFCLDHSPILSLKVTENTFK